MAKHKTTTKPLTRLLEQSNSPVYFVSPDYSITYANNACAEWLKIDRESLVGKTLVYNAASHESDPTPTSGLCPPPTLFETGPDSEHQRQGHISKGGQGSPIAWRRADFTPIFDDHRILLGVLVVVACNDMSSPPKLEPNPAEQSPSQLHCAIAQIRAEADRRFSMDSLAGNSPFAIRLRRQVDSAAKSKTDVLIFGPTGSGKEHTARTIHSARRHESESKLLTIHGSIADPVTIQQTIKRATETQSSFGPAANQKDPEWLLLLDVDQLNDAAQRELLGFFQIPNFPLRTIATATQAVIPLAEQGAFNNELAHYLSTMTIELVSLEQRRMDIPLLAQTILEKENGLREQPLSGFSAESMNLMGEYTWPENLDELIRTIQSACTNARTSVIDVDDLPDNFFQAIRALRIGTADQTHIQLDDYLGQIESELIRRALIQSKGNKSRAAKMLGVGRSKLLRRIQILDVEDATSNESRDQEDSTQIDPSAFEELEP